MFLSEWRQFPPAPCLAGEKLDDSSRLDVVEIAHVPEMLPRFFPSWSGEGLISTPVPPKFRRTFLGHLYTNKEYSEGFTFCGVKRKQKC